MLIKVNPALGKNYKYLALVFSQIGVFNKIILEVNYAINDNYLSSSVICLLTNNSLGLITGKIIPLKSVPFVLSKIIPLAVE